MIKARALDLPRPGPLPAVLLVGDTGIEPVTSSVSGKRSPAELIARDLAEVETGFEPVYTALQAVASPLGHSTNVGRLWRPPSGRRDSNPRPSPWQGDALPAALRPHVPGVPGDG